MIDLATDDPNLPVLIEMVTEHVLTVTGKYAEAGLEALIFHTDIGTQEALMISPAAFRRHIKPMFARVGEACRRAGVHMGLSSDGHVLEIVEDFVECGVSFHDPQFRANTLEGIARAYKGRLCAKVDLDRQMFRFCTPQDIHRQVEEVVAAMAAPEGGLIVMGQAWDADLPLENIEALCAALEQVRTTPLQQFCK